MARKTNSLNLYKKAAKELNGSDVKPVYFLCGEEDFFIDQLQELAVAHVPEEQRDFNLDLIYGQDHSVDRVLDIAQSYPMMAEKRVLIVRNFFMLEKPGVLSDADEGARAMNDFIPYFKNPNPATLLVLIDEKKPKGNSKLGKAVKKGDHVGYFQFDAIPDYQLADWIIEWARSEHGKTMTADAAQMLGQYVGNHLKQLAVEIQKLATYREGAGDIRAEDIKKVIGLTREYSIFELKDAVMARDMDQSLFIVDQMLQHSNTTEVGEVIRSVGFFYSVFANIWQIRRLSEKGMAKSQVQQTIGIGSSYYFNNLWKDASNFRLADMPRVFEALLDADASIKGFSGINDPAAIMAMMIKRIIG